ncbi:MAG: PilW family protein [Burkholderiales bacterium]|jgi:prepilin-type N-terminal cleavage/methylation domain-containing protein|nr:PilW family protein [Burkholderiales bacterium]
MFATTQKYRRQLGFTLVELMVGVLIGTAAMVITYQIYDRAQAAQRSLSTVNEAQLTGLYAMRMLEHNISNAGAVIMANRKGADDTTLNLNKCPITTMNQVTAGDFPQDAAAPRSNMTLYPIPALILPNPQAPNFDILNVFYAQTDNADTPLRFTGSGSTITVERAYIMRQNSVLVDVNNAAGTCRLTMVTGIQKDAATDNWIVSLSPPLQSASSQLIDLGRATWRTFYVNPANNTLNMVTWMPNLDNNNTSISFTNRVDAIASNVVAFHAQYGVDTGGGANGEPDGVVDTWFNAGNESTAKDALELGRFLPNASSQTAAVDISQIRVLRVGIVLRTEEPVKVIRNSDNNSIQEGGVLDQPTSLTLFGTCGTSACVPVTVLLPVDENPDLIYRHRAYETVIQMQNVIWNQKQNASSQASGRTP